MVTRTRGAVGEPVRRRSQQGCWLAGRMPASRGCGQIQGLLLFCESYTRNWVWFVFFAGCRGAHRFRCLSDGEFRASESWHRSALRAGAPKTSVHRSTREDVGLKRWRAEAKGENICGWGVNGAAGLRAYGVLSASQMLPVNSCMAQKSLSLVTAFPNAENSGRRAL